MRHKLQLIGDYPDPSHVNILTFITQSIKYAPLSKPNQHSEFFTPNFVLAIVTEKKCSKGSFI